MAPAPKRPSSNPAGRPSLKNTKKRPKRAVVSASHTYEEKYDVIAFLDKCGSMSQTIYKFFPAFTPKEREAVRKKISSWANRQRSQITFFAGHPKYRGQRNYRCEGLGKVLPAEAENQIKLWVLDLRGGGVPVSRQMIRLKAVEVACDHGVSAGFSASYTWLERFLREHDLLLTTRSDLVDECESTLQREMDALCLQHKITKIYRAEQTGINYEYIPKPAGSVTTWVRCGGSERDRITAMLLGDADGHKYPLFLVMKSVAENRPEVRQEFDTTEWGDVQIIQEETGGVVYGNPTASWNSDLSLAFLRFHFGRRAHLSSKVLLLWDAHWTSDVQAYADSINVVLHPAPPADVVWKNTLTNRLRRIWIDSLRGQVANHTPATAFVLAPPHRIELAAWVQSTWDSLSKNAIKNGFNKGGLDSSSPNAANEEEDAVSYLEPSLLEALVKLKIAHDVDEDVVITSPERPPQHAPSPERPHQRILRSPPDVPPIRAMGACIGRSDAARRPDRQLTTLPRLFELVPSFPKRLPTRADYTEIAALEQNKELWTELTETLIAACPSVPNIQRVGHETPLHW